ncbi:MAG: adenylosuccinate synthase [Spirochaetales bacterium]|nr:adenylosuccinate synthase [Spirochaetales bacterium]
MIKAVVGLNWGDEGKGRMVDYFASEADMAIRFQGGSNAGHTVINEKGKFAFHCFPSGTCYEHVTNIIASGAVLNLADFKTELETIKKQIDNFTLLISDRAILTLPYHIQLEKLEEIRLRDKKYGSTLSGIAPTYADKYLKKGIQTGELFNPGYLKDRIKDIVEYKNLQLNGFYGAEKLDPVRVFEEILEAGEIIKPFITDIGPVVREAINRNKNILLEAQLGALRDVSLGIYPYTTSSSVLAGYACASVPVPPSKVQIVVGITKAYSTCVGEGAFTTEIFDETGDRIRKVGKEYGAKTGRPRRIGYFDAVATRYGCELQGASEVTVTCLDVLSGIKELPVCTAYEIDGKKTDRFPIYSSLVKAKPVYTVLPGWEEDISKIRHFEDLPANTKAYLRFMEKEMGVPISYVSVGPEREALIRM